LGYSLAVVVDLIVLSSTTHLERVTRAWAVAALCREGRSGRRHGIVAQAAVTVHHTGDGVASSSTSVDAVFNGHGAEGGRNVVVEGLEAT
jgi:hypothetical protein